MTIQHSADANAVGREQYALLAQHFITEHSRITLIPSLREAVNSADCPECSRWRRANAAYGRDGDDAMHRILLEIFN